MAADEGSSLPLATVDAGVYRKVIGAVTSGVMVLTARDDAGDHGMTISAVCSLSMEPPMLLVCLNSRSRTQRRSGRCRMFRRPRPRREAGLDR